MLIEKKAGSSLKSVHPFLTPSKVDTAGRTNMGSLCSHGASNQIVVGADKGTMPDLVRHGALFTKERLTS